MQEPIINKVAQSGLITFNLEKYYPQGERKHIDLKEVLFMGMILKEKDFRQWVKELDWSQYQNTFVAVNCTADVIIPTWAYMLVASKLSGVATKVVFGSLQTLESVLWEEAINQINADEFKDQKMVIKGCSNLPVSEAAYLLITQKLTPVVSSLMFGEPCSTVPVYKAPKKEN
jgi:hypothetical protein